MNRDSASRPHPEELCLTSTVGATIPGEMKENQFPGTDAFCFYCEEPTAVRNGRAAGRRAVLRFSVRLAK